MADNKNYSKRVIAQAVVQRIEDTREPNEIKTKYLKGYPSPNIIKLKDDKENVEMLYPDIIAEYENETHLYEIELDEEINHQKWKFMSLYANEKNGNLYLIIPDFMRNKVKQSLNDNQINAAILYFDSKTESN